MFTNADKIRHMTDEELAELLSCGEHWEDICEECEHFGGCQDNAFCTSKVLEWLQKEVR